MKLTKAIDLDYKCLKRYFSKEFELMQTALEEEKSAPIVVEDANADESQAAYHGFSHLIMPDMVSNIYSFLDFRVKRLCDFQQHKRQLVLSYKDIKGNNDLDTYHKYLTKYAGIDLTVVQNNYQQIDQLRKVRNRFIHNGGDIPCNEEIKYSSIQGISVISSPTICRLFIKEQFIWDMLEHVRKYLHQVAIS
jgi:hypothetical protein